MPFRCEVCGAEFNPEEGGKCGSCGRVICRKHFRVSPPGKPALKCRECESGGVRRATALLFVLSGLLLLSSFNTHLHRNMTFKPGVIERGGVPAQVKALHAAVTRLEAGYDHAIDYGTGHEKGISMFFDAYETGKTLYTTVKDNFGPVKPKERLTSTEIAVHLMLLFFIFIVYFWLIGSLVEYLHRRVFRKSYLITIGFIVLILGSPALMTFNGVHSKPGVLGKIVAIFQCGVMLGAIAVVLVQILRKEKGTCGWQPMLCLGWIKKKVLDGMILRKHE